MWVANVVVSLSPSLQELTSLKEENDELARMIDDLAAASPTASTIDREMLDAPTPTPDPTTSGRSNPSHSSSGSMEGIQDAAALVIQSQVDNLTFELSARDQPVLGLERFVDEGIRGFNQMSDILNGQILAEEATVRTLQRQIQDLEAGNQRLLRDLAQWKCGLCSVSAAQSTPTYVNFVSFPIEAGESSHSVHLANDTCIDLTLLAVEQDLAALTRQWSTLDANAAFFGVGDSMSIADMGTEGVQFVGDIDGKYVPYSNHTGTGTSAGDEEGEGEDDCGPIDRPKLVTRARLVAKPKTKRAKLGYCASLPLPAAITFYRVIDSDSVTGGGTATATSAAADPDSVPLFAPLPGEVAFFSIGVDPTPISTSIAPPFKPPSSPVNPTEEEEERTSSESDDDDEMSDDAADDNGEDDNEDNTQVTPKKTKYLSPPHRLSSH